MSSSWSPPVSPSSPSSPSPSRARRAGAVVLASAALAFAAVVPTAGTASAEPCGGMHHVADDAVYFNCTDHDVKIYVSSYPIDYEACVAPHGEFHSPWWRTVNQYKIRDNCD
ncbi:hypothetical protein [Yinghuangia seranimata]|uniref:hypothetical protein n=1 Tax=Yinghuangia seranimata TaxID=408067 RepID=UPI00248B9B05|nr:hypothetical protein [Yinghuangia seranimata]MDI2126441.1 hypothetical protein [Yinghuangia seranimata]